MIKRKKKSQAIDRKTVTLQPLYLNDEDGLYGSEN